MFHRWGQLVSRFPLAIVVAWVVLAVAAIRTSPEWSEVAQEGEFVFLPQDSASKQAEALYRQAFLTAEAGESGDDAAYMAQNPLGSTVAIVAQREDLPDGLTAADKVFIDRVLRVGLETIRLTTPSGYTEAEDSAAYITTIVRRVITRTGEAESSATLEDIETAVASVVEQVPATGEDPVAVSRPPGDEQIVTAVWTFRAKGVGPLLISKDKKSTLVVADLKTEFLDRENGLLLDRIEAFVQEVIVHRDEYARELQLPANLELAISGSATVGRDMLVAERQSTQNTELWTKILVVVLLLLLYRAPLLMAIPLATVGITTEMTVSLVRHMAKLEWIDVFSGLGLYVTVVVYGAGVDFCLFLIARYREELNAGASFRDAVVHSIERVGIALATSAGTSIAGIGMMMFAEFGKFPQAGFAISFGLAIVLVCSLTLTPALLLLTQRWAFWPDIRRERLTPREGWIPPTRAWSILTREPQWSQRIWDKIAGVLARRPGTVIAVSLMLMTPFVVIALLNYNRLSYGLLSELHPSVTSVVGANAVKEHFPAGMTGVTTVLLRNPDFNYDTTQRAADGQKLARVITDELERAGESLGLAEVRSQSDPIGTSNSADLPRSVAERIAARRMAQKAYVSTRGETAGDVIRFDLVFEFDPFTRESISRLNAAEAALRGALATLAASAANEEDAETAALYKNLPESTEVLTLGSTASLRDLKVVTDRDRVWIAVYVTIAVYLVLIVLLGRPAISLYLIATVVFSYLVTLGVTHFVFWLIHPDVYPGMDWKAPIFVFTILVAMGEDYNVLLMARVDEEQRRHGTIGGVLSALKKTGGIISSCGIIMAGTFASLMTGTLTGIIQLGFALAFGVLLDTFVVRPILVPAYLVMLYSGRFGRFSRLLGAKETTAGAPPIPDPGPEDDPAAPAVSLTHDATMGSDPLAREPYRRDS